VDPVGNTIILRQGGFAGTKSAFGFLHALLDHNVDDHVIERVVSSTLRSRRDESGSATTPSYERPANR
jgi:hypothetical protein